MTPSFLDLPAEVRNEIFRLSLQHGLIHINSVDRPFPIRNGKCTFKPLPTTERRFRYYVCPHNDDELSMHDRWVQNARSGGEYSMMHGLMRHQQCETALLEAEFEQPSTNLLALRGVCQQIHNETHLVPYSCNGFSFSNFTAFRQFIQRLGPEQRKALKTIRLEVELEEPSTCGLDSTLVAELTSLRALHLSLRPNPTNLTLRENRLSPFLLFRGLNLEQCTLIMGSCTKWQWDVHRACSTSYTPTGHVTRHSATKSIRRGPHLIFRPLITPSISDRLAFAESFRALLLSKPVSKGSIGHSLRKRKRGQPADCLDALLETV